MSTQSSPIEIEVKSVASGSYSTIRTFDSYFFERTILTPAAAFRFTAPGVDVASRLAIRSCDTVNIFAVPATGAIQQVGTGFIDETDTHIVPGRVEYLLTGRDTLGQLVDNAAVDANNGIINIKQATLGTILTVLIKNTRIPQGFKQQQVPSGTFLFQTRAGETKINALQRYLEYSNTLIWSQPNGQLVVGKPNFAQSVSGVLTMSSTGSSMNNVVEARVRRNTNQAIRQIVTQLQTLDQVDAGQFTILNQDADVQAVSGAGGGRSVYNVFSYGQGTDAVNQIVQVGNQSGNPNQIGAAMCRREIARENQRVIDVECVVRDHINENGAAYNIDQLYTVKIDDEQLNADMYVYAISYELTLEHGMLTRLKLCRKGSLVADSSILAPQSVSGGA